MAKKREELSIERRVLLAVGEVGEVFVAKGDWRSLLCDRARALTNASMGLVGEVQGWSSEDHARPVRVTDTGLDSSARKVFISYLSDRACTDPFLQKIVESPRLPRTWLRGRHVDDASWYGSPYVQEYRRKAHVNDMMLSVLAPRGETHALCIAVHRAWEDGQYAPQDVRAMQMLQQALQGWSKVLMGEHASKASNLSPRLTQILQLLVQGKTEKQVAQEIGISAHTVHMHVGRLHKVLGVSNRAELVAAALK